MSNKRKIRSLVKWISDAETAIRFTNRFLLIDDKIPPGIAEHSLYLYTDKIEKAIIWLGENGVTNLWIDNEKIDMSGYVREYKSLQGRPREHKETDDLDFITRWNHLGKHTYMEIAAACGVTQPQISRWVKNGPPDYAMIILKQAELIQAMSINIKCAG